MTIRMIDNGEIVTVDDCWGERLIEHGKAEPVALKSGKAEVTVADRIPQKETEAPETDAAKGAAKTAKPGKKR